MWTRKSKQRITCSPIEMAPRGLSAPCVMVSVARTKRQKASARFMILRSNGFSWKYIHLTHGLSVIWFASVLDYVKENHSKESRSRLEWKQWFGKEESSPGFNLNSTKLDVISENWPLRLGSGQNSVSIITHAKGKGLNEDFGLVTLASPPGIKPWSLRFEEGVLGDGSAAAWSLGGWFVPEEVFLLANVDIRRRQQVRAINLVTCQGFRTWVTPSSYS